MLPLSLLACTSQDDVRELLGSEGITAVDVDGQEGTRRICLMRSDEKTPCRVEGANLVVRGLGPKGQLLARWRVGSPTTLHVVLFGGQVALCRQPQPGTDARLVVKQLPLSEMPSPDLWSSAHILDLSDDAPDLCEERS